MAKIKFGMMMTDASGKLGGQVFSKNRGGSYVRTKTTPGNPQTSFQMAVRGLFAGISSSWSELSASSRLSFNNFVSSYATTDIFGDLRNPSGKALFQRLNQNLGNSGQALITTCVSPLEVPFAGINGALADISDELFSVNYTNDCTGSKVIVFATPQMSRGTSFVKNKLRQLTVVDGLAGGSIDIWSDYSTRFGDLDAGSNVVVGLKTVNANGQASPLETVTVTISA